PARYEHHKGRQPAPPMHMAHRTVAVPMPRGITGTPLVAATPGTAMPGLMAGPMAGGMPDMPMPGGPLPPRHSHGTDFSDAPEELIPYLADLDELTHAPQPGMIPKPPHTLHVPLFFHMMSGGRTSPVFQSAHLTPGTTYTSPVFSFATVYNY